MHPLKRAFCLNYGKLLGLHPFTKMVIKVKNHITVQYWYCQSFLGSSKDLTIKLYQHLNSHNLLPNARPGFRALHYILTCLLKTSMTMGLVLVDLRKELKLDYNILCQNLEHYGLQENELSWFKSYLSNRKKY